MLDTNKLSKIANASLVQLPTPSSISYIWNFGSLLGVVLIVQILTGLALAIHYGCDVRIAFNSVNHIIRDVNLGWAFRAIHSNGARMFFICLYAHIARGLYYGSYNLLHVWAIGCTILLLTIATAFLGYVLPWGQIRFWGATVITNLFRAIPYVGEDIVLWLWGGFAVGNSALTRFFALHFIMPFVILAIRALHLFFLHLTGSRNPLGVSSKKDMIKFNPYFVWKDLAGFILMVAVLLYLSIFYPWTLGDPENFIPANPLVTPIHIQPEWYFLFAYAILRRIPNKLGGVIALFLRVLVFYTLPFAQATVFKSNVFIPINKFMFWTFIIIFLLLTWIGAKPVEAPYILTGQILSVLYFVWFLAYFVLAAAWPRLI
jgi:ubiquinol-cytochrome c reductase cytochrome b subunit